MGLLSLLASPNILQHNCLAEIYDQILIQCILTEVIKNMRGKRLLHIRANVVINVCKPDHISDCSFELMTYYNVLKFKHPFKCM